jgi:hypothetical protein
MPDKPKPPLKDDDRNFTPLALLKAVKNAHDLLAAQALVCICVKLLEEGVNLQEPVDLCNLDPCAV